jgi:cytochrome c-type biogenesis protein CcmF
MLLPFTMGEWTPMIAFGLLLALWVVISGFVNLRQRVSQLRTANGLGTGAQLRGLPRGYYGMLLAHAGVAVFIAGVTLVKGYEVEKDVRMQTGDTVEVGGYTFRLDGLVQVPGPNYEATRGLVSVLKNGKSVRTMFPEKRLYHVQQMSMTEAAIDTGFTGDLYVSLGEPVGNDAWVVRIYHKPFIDWIWGGAFLMALGGILAITDRRYRLARKAEREASSTVSAVTA